MCNIPIYTISCTDFQHKQAVASAVEAALERLTLGSSALLHLHLCPPSCHAPAPASVISTSDKTTTQHGAPSSPLLVPAPYRSLTLRLLRVENVGEIYFGGCFLISLSTMCFSVFPLRAPFHFSSPFHCTNATHSHHSLSLSWN